MNNRKPESLQNCLKNFKESWSDLDNLINLKSHWEEIIGKDLAQECSPLRIENEVLTIVANHPQWRQELIYYKHKIKESISNYGIKLRNIRIIQNYNNEERKKKFESKTDWEDHPSLIKNSEVVNCKFCNCPTPKGEIIRWGRCTFCWRKKK